MPHAAGKVGYEPSVQKIDVQPSATKTIRTSASTVPEAPIRLRLVIGGEAPARSLPANRETSDANSGQ